MDNKKTLWVIVGVVVLVVIIWAIVMYNNSHKAQPVANTNPAAITPTPTPAPAGTKPSSSNLSYNKALVKYGTNRIQFQQNCQALPTSSVFKNGATIMLDNRATIAHTVKLDKTYVLPADSFAIDTLTSSVLPHKILVDCDKSQNVATVTIEK